MSEIADLFKGRSELAFNRLKIFNSLSFKQIRDIFRFTLQNLSISFGRTIIPRQKSKGRARADATRQKQFLELQTS